MVSDPLQALKEFEVKADGRMAALSIWCLPFRSVYSFAVLGAEMAFGGQRFRVDRMPDVDKGATLLASYSYWLENLRHCTPEVGSSLENALSVIGPPEAEEIKQALVYSRFCEIMPFARHKALSVAVSETGFRLTYPSADASRYEAMDVVASELALTALEERFESDPGPLFKMVESPQSWDEHDLNIVLQPAFTFQKANVREDAFIGAEAYERVLGFTHPEFLNVRAAMMAFGSWCLGMATAAEVLALEASGEKQLHLQNECFEWLAPLLNAATVYKIIETLSQVPSDRVNAILAYFRDDHVGQGAVSGEGYLAPLQVVGTELLVFPTAMHLMTPERNILYVLNKRNRDQFNDLVSAELEPSLLAHAMNLLERLDGVQVKPNVRWKEREIDLLVYCPKTRTALQIQAKAAIPAVGARMTRQIEDNCLTAINQLKWFEVLPAVERDAIIQTSFGGGAQDVFWVSGVLSRSSFGTVRAWQAMEGRAALNLTLLQGVVEQLAKETSADLRAIPELASKLLSEIADEATQGWEEEVLNLFGTELRVPMLRLDRAAIARRKAALIARR